MNPDELDKWWKQMQQWMPGGYWLGHSMQQYFKLMAPIISSEGLTSPTQPTWTPEQRMRHREWERGARRRRVEAHDGAWPDLDPHSSDWWDGYSGRPFRREVTA